MLKIFPDRLPGQVAAAVCNTIASSRSSARSSTVSSGAVSSHTSIRLSVTSAGDAICLSYCWLKEILRFLILSLASLMDVGKGKSLHWEIKSTCVECLGSQEGYIETRTHGKKDLNSYQELFQRSESADLECAGQWRLSHMEWASVSAAFGRQCCKSIHVDNG